MGRHMIEVRDVHDRKKGHVTQKAADAMLITGAAKRRYQLDGKGRKLGGWWIQEVVPVMRNCRAALDAHDMRSAAGENGFAEMHRAMQRIQDRVPRRTVSYV